jgi:exoribonuclease R
MPGQMTTTTKMIVGVLEMTSKYRYGLTSRGASIYLFVPYDESLPSFIVGCSQKNPGTNMIARVEVPALVETTGIEKPRGTLISLIGPVGDLFAEREGLLQHYCPATYKKGVVMPPIHEMHDAGRRDVSAATGWDVFHIDPPGCRDIDDAIAWNRAENAWCVTIADAAAAVPADSEVDRIARRIGSTFYTLGGVAIRPMLPASISEDTASLLPGQRRRGVSLFLYPNGATHFELTWITVAHSYTYETFPESDLAKEIAEVKKTPLPDPHAWIEMWMISYNMEVANILKRAGRGLLRTQKAADAAEVTRWAGLDPALQFLAMETATYEIATTEGDQGHATLELSAYCHASSPIRRYADLTNQRILKALSCGETVAQTPPDLTEALNVRMKMNRQWSRDLSFLEHVTPGRIHIIDVVWISESQVWVPTWKRILRIRHDPADTPSVGSRGQLEIFCDPSKRNWKRRVLTAPINP